MSYHARKKKGKKQGKKKKQPLKPIAIVEKEPEWPINSMDLDGSEADFECIVDNDANGLAKLIHYELEVRPFAIQMLDNIFKRIYHTNAEVAFKICADLLREDEIDLVRNYIGIMEDDEEYSDEDNFYDGIFQNNLVYIAKDYDKSRALVNYFKMAPKDYDWEQIYDSIDINLKVNYFAHKERTEFYIYILSAAIEANIGDIIIYIIDLAEGKSCCPDCKQTYKIEAKLNDIITEYKKRSLIEMKRIIESCEQNIIVAERKLTAALMSNEKIKMMINEYIELKNSQEGKINDYYRVRNYPGMKNLLFNYGGRKMNRFDEMETISLPISKSSTLTIPSLQSVLAESYHESRTHLKRPQLKSSIVTNEVTTNEITTDQKMNEVTTNEVTAINEVKRNELTIIEPTTNQKMNEVTAMNEVKKNKLTTIEPTIKLTVIKPSTTEPETIKPSTTEPETIKQETIKQETIELKTSEATIIEPPIKPPIIKPETIEPKTNEAPIHESVIRSIPMPKSVIPTKIPLPLKTLAQSKIPPPSRIPTPSKTQNK